MRCFCRRFAPASPDGEACHRRCNVHVHVDELLNVAEDQLEVKHQSAPYADAHAEGESGHEDLGVGGEGKDVG